jgi:uncharacterized membrane protein
LVADTAPDSRPFTSNRQGLRLMEESNAYERYRRIWFALCVPAFLSMLTIVWLMVHKTIGV